MKDSSLLKEYDLKHYVNTIKHDKSPLNHYYIFKEYMGLSENVVYPEKPNGFADHYPY